MYQTPVMSATRLSRIAGPVCITLLAMRPAKSFWKNTHDWRATCQWLCQRTRFWTFAEIAWLATIFCAVIASGRATMTSSAMPSSRCQDCANSRSGALAVTKVTRRPMNTGIIESSSATTRPTANSAVNSPLA
jgi:hypothetical protein